MSPPVSERQLAGERKNEARTARQVRRTPVVVLGLLVVLTFAVGITAAIDLRRLDTPAGAAQGWVTATLSGDCARYRLLSTPDEPESRGEQQLCDDLADVARERLAAAVRTRVRVVGDVVQEGGLARVSVELAPEGGTAVVKQLRLVERDRWRVVRDAAACELVRCP
ncbi:MAG: hypothetical protein Q8R60_03670 [Mycobacteriales bacterium]|nr:hypothetical protein [Mycobacteriales bacterium]